MRARFSRAAITATLLLGSVGPSLAGEIDGFFADLDFSAAAAPAPGVTAEPARPGGALAAAPVGPGPAASSRQPGSDPLGMDALFDGPGDDHGRGGASGLPRIVEAAPLDARTRVSAPVPGAPAKDLAKDSAKDLAKDPAKQPASGRIDLDPEPDVAIKPPAATPEAVEMPKATTGAAASAAPAQPLPPLNAAIKAALDKRDALAIHGADARERRKEREAIAFFYAAHGFAPLWSDGGRPVAAVDPVLARLGRAGEDALTPPPPPKALVADGASDAVAASEIALSDAVVAYARQATGSRVDPRSIGPLIGAKPQLADPAEVLESVAAAAGAAGDTLRGLNPIEPRYVALRDRLGELRAAHTRSAGVIPAGPPLRVGMRDARVPLLRARFALGSGDLDALVYDAGVADAVAGFQRANGLPASGELTRRTVAVLSGGLPPPPARLEGTLIANMEMWRWMPRDLGRDRIEVDVPAFTVTVFHDGVPAAHNRVVVGKLDTPTPLFSNTMKFLIVNPVWNVPESIVDNELLRKDGDASGIRARGFDVSTRNGKLVVKQPAGEKNALGRIKFMFPNDYSVYLHDTPSKALFSTSRRAYSHGCVRVDQPFDFAESVLNDGLADGTRASGGKAVWSQERLHKLLGDKERYVYLPKPLPIHIAYFTATVDRDSGRLQLRDDVYDYARKVAVALGQGGPGEPAGEATRATLATAHRHPRAIASE